MKHLILSVLVIAWCFLHSAMISVSVTEYFHKRLGSAFRFYRLFFNMVSALTLIPVILYTYSARSEPIFRWDGYMRIFQILLLGTAALLFFLGASRYDAAQLLGFKQIREGTSAKGITEAGELETSGILGIIRHPWYLATILLIWARQLDLSTILVNTILTSYVITGSYLEEKNWCGNLGRDTASIKKRYPCSSRISG